MPVHTTHPNNAASRNGNIMVVFTALFIVFSLTLNYGMFFRGLGMLVLGVISLLILSQMKLVGFKMLNAVGIFGFFLVLANVLVKYSSIDVSGGAAGIEFITPILSFLFVVANYLAFKQTPKMLDKSIRLATAIFVVLCLVDLALRLNNAGVSCFSLTSSCRSASKFGGLAFNSNITAVPIVAMFFFARGGKMMIFWGVLLYLTLNRSGLLAAIPAIGFLIIFDKTLPLIHRWRLALRIALILPFLAYGLFKIYPLIALYVSSDGSFLSKVNFFNLTVEKISDAPWRILIFGDQLNYFHIITTYSYNGWSVHLAILKALWYYGLMGVIFFSFLYFALMRLSIRAFSCAVTFVIMGFAGFAIFNPVMLVFPLFVRARRNFDQQEQIDQ